jgi:uncharacterized protein YcbK (DUF882 family)
MRLKHFHPEEKGWKGNFHKVNGLLLLLLDALREEIGCPFVIHCAYETSGHSPKSQHYLGNAVDFHIEGLPFLEAMGRMERALENLQVSDRVGLGIYPHWLHPGFHLDVRGLRARWGRFDYGLSRGYVSYEVARRWVMENLSG